MATALRKKLRNLERILKVIREKREWNRKHPAKYQTVRLPLNPPKKKRR